MLGRMRFATVGGCSLAAAMLLFAPLAAKAESGCGACPAAPPHPAAILYELSDESSLAIGCLEPCLCPIFSRNGLRGTFVLTPALSGGLFDEYLVCDLDWTIPASGVGPAVHISGSGSYRVGGEFAVQHELKLCLSVNGGDAQRFESGLVPGGGAFPRIEIPVAVHGFFCFDTVIQVSAAPSSADIPLDKTGMVGFRARPNPSHGPVELDLFRLRSGVVSLGVLDIQGRRIRTIVRGAWLPAGRTRLRWDARTDAGHPAPAGVYVIRAIAGGAIYSQRLVLVR